MRAIGYTATGGVDVLTDVERPDPTPGPRDLLVRVEAVSVNPVDTKVRSSSGPDDDGPQVIGWDAAGVVEAVGGEVTLFAPGDRVFYAGALDRPGSNAELQVVDERIVGRHPKTLDAASAAALPLTAITAWEVLFDRLGVTSDTTGTLLVVGGAGGVGSMLVQLAQQLTTLRVVATASRPETVQWVTDLGADVVVDHHDLAASLAAEGIDQVELIAALTGTDQHLSTYAEVVAPQGRIAVIDDPETLDVVPLKSKSVSVHWELMFTRSLFATPDMEAQHRILDRVADLIDDGTLRTTLNRTMGTICAADLRQAHELQESGAAIGKSVLVGWPD